MTHPRTADCASVAIRPVKAIDYKDNLRCHLNYLDENLMEKTEDWNGGISSVSL